MASPAPQPSGRKARGRQAPKPIISRQRVQAARMRRQGKTPGTPQQPLWPTGQKTLRAGQKRRVIQRRVAIQRQQAYQAMKSTYALPPTGSSQQGGGNFAYPKSSQPSAQAGQPSKIAPQRGARPTPRLATSGGISPDIDTEAPLKRRMVGKRSQPARRAIAQAPRQPVKVQIVPGKPQRSPGTPPESAIFLLGMGLVTVALLHSTIIPGFDIAMHGKKATHKVTLPAMQALALVAFVFVLVWVSDISDTAARMVFWFLLALWAVYLLLSPDQPLQWAAGLVGAGGSEPASAAANTSTAAQTNAGNASVQPQKVGA